MKKNIPNWQSNLQNSFTSGLEQAGIESAGFYLVGVSGGRDSVFLVHLLQLSGIEFCIAHLNHSIRENAHRDQQFVRSLANDLGVRFFTKTFEVLEFADQEKLSLEEAARIARYKYLMACAQDAGCEGVIVGHHADDQVETVLMHLLRGSGIAGLTGMSYREYNSAFSSSVPVLRPMLGIWRSEIQKYCIEAGLMYVEDETNSDIDIHRNRLRHSLIPDLESYNLNVRQHLWQTALIAQQAEKIIDNSLANVWETLQVLSTEDLVVFDLLKFRSQQVEIQQAIIRKVSGLLLPTMRDFGYDLTLKTQATIMNPPEGGHWQIMGELFGVIHKDILAFGQLHAISSYLKQLWPQWVAETSPFIYQDERMIEICSPYLILCEELRRNDVDGEPWKYSEKDEAWLDVDSIKQGLTIRHFTEGDRFSPLGMSGKRRKISDYFIDQKIPQQARKFFPLVCDEQGVLWVVGEQIDTRARITDSSKRILRLKLIRKEPV